MAIRVSCDQCGRSYKVKTKLAGQRFRCKDCDGVIHIPASDDETAAARPQDVESPDGELPDNDEPADELTPTHSLPTGTGVGLPPVGDSTSAYPSSSSGRSKSSRRSLRRKIPWRALTGSAVVLLIVSAIISFGGHKDEQDSQIKETSVPDSSEEISSEEKLSEMQKVVEDQLQPDQLTISLGDVLDEVRKIDAAQNPSWREFSLLDQPISILMPGSPKPLIRRQGGATVLGAVVEARSELECNYSMMFIDYKIPPGKTIDVNRQIDQAKQGLLQNVPFGRLVAERTISLADEGGNEHPGCELDIEGKIRGKEMKYIYRIYMVGTKMIITFIGGEQQYAEEFEPNSTKFLDSLKITASIPPLNSNGISEKSITPLVAPKPSEN